jgi:hypothetical protein
MGTVLTAGDIMSARKKRMNKIEFIASLPDILSAINIAGQDGNSRIKLDIPASDIAAITKLIEMKGQAFKVTIEGIAEGDW